MRYKKEPWVHDYLMHEDAIVIVWSFVTEYNGARTWQKASFPCIEVHCGRIVFCRRKVAVAHEQLQDNNRASRVPFRRRVLVCTCFHWSCQYVHLVISRHPQKMGFSRRPMLCEVRYLAGINQRSGLRSPCVVISARSVLCKSGKGTFSRIFSPKAVTLRMLPRHT
jgi:hypothetical protein